MKKITTAIFILMAVTGDIFAQGWGTEMGLNYAYTAPLGSMKNNIRQGHGVTLNLGKITPNKRFALGVELQYTGYGYDKSMQQLDMPDGNVADMEVTVSNSFLNFMAYGRGYLITEGKFLPYVTVKGGYTHYVTDLNIYDPDEWDSCSPVESEILQKDGTMVGSIGAGFRLDFSSIFKRANPDRFYIDFNASVSQGGTVRYMNTDAPDHHAATHDATDAVEAEFINTQTQVYHTHHVGTLYTSPVQLMDVRLGAFLRLGR